MSKIKRLLAILVAVLTILVSVAACNANATWIMKVDDEQIPVGIYICYLMDSDNEAQGKVDEEIAAQTTTSEDAEATTEVATEATTEAIDYYEHKIDEKSYDEWVKDNAIQMVKEHIVVKQKCKEYKIELDEDQKSSITSLWTTAATTDGKTYGDFYEMNGISRASFEEYLTVAYLKDELLQYYYGADGVEPISNEELTKKLTENYATAYILSHSKMGLNEDQTSYENYSDEIIKEMKTAMDGYIKRLDKKEDYTKIEADFKKDMAKIVGTEESESAASDVVSVETEESEGTEATEEEEEELKATPNIQLRDISSEDDAISKTLKEAKVNKAGIAESDAEIMVYRKTDDITKNPYYLDSQKASLITDLKGDAFDEIIDTWAKDLKADLNKNAKSTYGPKELKNFDE